MQRVIFVLFALSICVAPACDSDESGGDNNGWIDATGGDTASGDTGAEDTGPEDTGPEDTGASDTGGPDTEPVDTESDDTQSDDTGPGDTGASDTNPTDAADADTGESDTGDADTGVADTGSDASDTNADTADASTPDWRKCTEPTDCIIESNSCCDVCGEPSLGDVDAVNKKFTSEHFDDVCPVPQPCPRCVSAINPDLIGICQQNFCEALDVREEPFTSCRNDSDCTLRTRECCECGGTTDASMLIAVSVTGSQEYASLVCPAGTFCPQCIPQYPENAKAVCASDGHCEVEITRQ